MYCEGVKQDIYIRRAWASCLTITFPSVVDITVGSYDVHVHIYATEVGFGLKYLLYGCVSV